MTDETNLRGVSRYLSEVPSRERCCVNAVCELQCVRCGNGRGEKRQVKSDLFLIVLFIFHGKVLKVNNFATNAWYDDEMEDEELLALLA